MHVYRPVLTSLGNHPITEARTVYHVGVVTEKWAVDGTSDVLSPESIFILNINPQPFIFDFFTSEYHKISHVLRSFRYSLLCFSGQCSRTDPLQGYSCEHACSPVAGGPPKRVVHEVCFHVCYIVERRRRARRVVDALIHQTRGDNCRRGADSIAQKRPHRRRQQWAADEVRFRAIEEMALFPGPLGFPTRSKVPSEVPQARLAEGDAPY